MKTLECAGYKTWTDCGYEYDCEYKTDVGCIDCVCTGGEFDPRYNMNKQPYKLSKFIIHTRDIARSNYANKHN
jgi:hypothetical protein